MHFTDSSNLTAPRLTRGGHMVSEARIARAGVQIYAGHEVGRPELARVRVLRPEAEVFNDDAMHSFAHRTLTLDHPGAPVTAANWKGLAVGYCGEKVARDGDFIRVPLVLMDQGAVDAVNSGKRQLSCGYTCDLAWQPGQTPDGEAYDAVQTKIRGNHLAIVEAGRAGPACRIGDGAGQEDHGQEDHGQEDHGQEGHSQAGQPGPADHAAATDGQAGAPPDKAGLEARLAAAEAEIARLARQHQAALAARDSELGARDATIEALKAKLIDPAALDALVAERADILAKARAIATGIAGNLAADLAANLAAPGLTSAAIRRAVVAARIGDAAIAARSDDYVAARFDALFDAAAAASSAHNPAAADPFRQALRTATPGSGRGGGDARAAAHAGMLDHLTQAWKGDNKDQS